MRWLLYSFASMVDYINNSPQHASKLCVPGWGFLFSLKKYLTFYFICIYLFHYYEDSSKMFFYSSYDFYCYHYYHSLIQIL